MKRDEIVKAVGKSTTQVKRYLHELGLTAPYPENTVQLVLDLIEEKKAKEPYWKGKHPSEETRKKLSESHKGKIPWNKGKVCESLRGKSHLLSEESKKKISLSLKKYNEGRPKKIKEPGRSLAAAQQERYKREKKHAYPFVSIPDFVKSKDDSLSISAIDRQVKSKNIKPAARIGNTNFYNPKDLDCNIKRLSGSSYGEQSLYSFVSSICKDAQQHNRTILSNKRELDIYCPEKKVAIEYNGLFWHSCQSFNGNIIKEDYHLQKTLECESKGIRLIHIFEDEWRSKQDIVKSLIASALGIYSSKIFARKCILTEVPKSVANEFFEINHIHGKDNLSFAFYGLKYNGQLVQVLSIRKNFANKSKEPELGRMCTLLNTQVVGGFSKLIKYALKEQKIEHISSFIDRRLFNGLGYKSSGWKTIGFSRPSYCYTDGVNRFNRQQYMKQSCLRKWPDADPTKTELQLCQEHGLYRIYDCGTIKVEL